MLEADLSSADHLHGPSASSCSVVNAQQAIEGLKNTDDYSNLRISYGKDRCAQSPRPHHFGVVPRPGRRSGVASPSGAAENVPNPLASTATSDGDRDGESAIASQAGVEAQEVAQE
jgi:hypothetical protein